MNATTNIDYRGARGSNTGDQFHEFWALQQVLDLLATNTELKAIGVEGVRTETLSQDADDPTWEGVDCTLYYGGTTLETADRIEFIQLKYSAANPETNWSLARLSANTAKTGNNSVIRKMADGFKVAKARKKQGAKLKFSFVSNQKLSSELQNVFSSQEIGVLGNEDIDRTRFNGLESLNAASGLSDSEFQDFFLTLDFSECGSHSRFAMREKVVARITDLLGDGVSSEVRELQVRIRELMLPERAGEIVTDKDILLWFGLSGREGLFPCVPDIRVPEHIVQRSDANKVAKMLREGERFVLVHGVGGCGKTTLMHQIIDHLPEESVMILFDCFGGGRCVYSDDKRHLPENAFLHLTNELAITLHLPLFVPRNPNSPATIQLFLDRLRLAGETLKRISPNGILLIVVDAADNSVAAAAAADPPENSFVHELFSANLSNLPENVRIVISCRTDPARRASLQLPSNIPEVICSSFSAKETKQHLEITFQNLDDTFVEQFHNLSNENPRVQAYAIAAANGDQTQVLASLLPGGKRLADVLKEYFDNALKKLGQRKIFEKLIGALAHLPAPISVPSLARISNCTEDTVRDLALDLMPGLRLSGDAVTVADEDFDTFIKAEGSKNHEVIIADIADDFFKTFHHDAYSSIHVADSFIAAGRAVNILSVIDQDPQASAIGDPIVRRQTQVRRLKLALAACQETGSKIDALKTILVSAEAKHDDSTLNDLLEKELDLSVEFGSSTLRRSILLDPDRIKKHGSFLAQDAVRAIRTGDRITSREQLYFHEAWLKRRHRESENKLEDWKVTDYDVSARVETILELAGPKAAFDELMRWSPRDVSIRVAFILIPQLIAAGKSHQIKTFLMDDRLPAPWNLLLWVSIAMAGESLDKPAIEKSLSCIKSRFIPNAGDVRITHSYDGWRAKLLDNFIMACELAFKLCLDDQVILNASNKILDVLGGNKKRRLYSSDAYRFDGLLRCWLLKARISGEIPKEDDFITYVRTLEHQPKSEKKRGRKRQNKYGHNTQSVRKDDEQRDGDIKALFPVYLARLDILSSARFNEQITKKQLDKLDGITSYDFDYHHESIYLREVAARSVMGLLIIEDIEAANLVKRASKVVDGRFSDFFSSRHRKLWSQMRLRTSEVDKLISLVANAAEDIRALRAASSDKMEAILELSRLILPVSRDDAESLFNDAIEIAKEIDREAIDQIDFMSVLAERARVSKQSDRRKIAADIYTFASGAAERLSDYDGFPWASVVHALTVVDDTTALAAICRWADDGTVRLDNTLDQFLHTALQRNLINPELAISLALLIGGADGKFHKDLVLRVSTEPQKYKAVIEELSKDSLMLSTQSSRLFLGQEIVDRISQGSCQEGPWLVRLRETIAFLRNLPDADPNTKLTVDSGNMARLTGDDEIVEEFQFDPQGRTFTTPELIEEVLVAAKSSDLPYDEREILRKMRDSSSSPRNRVKFLNALANVSEDSIWSTYRVEIISESLAVWKGSPAVDRWCKEILPSVISSHFKGVTFYFREGQSVLLQLLSYTESNNDSRIQILLAGVAQIGESLNSWTLFAVAGEIVKTLDADEAGELLLWYTHRLWSRLPIADHTQYSLTDIPNDTIEAISRFLYALMSDIDTRIRWKAAHALRRLAFLGCVDIFSTVVSQSNRVEDKAFRDPLSPYYFLAAKLWLTISLYRISAETPEVFNSCKAELIELATSPDLMHVGIREYAKRTLLQLESEGVISLTSFEGTQLDQVNIAQKGRVTEKNNTHRSLDRRKDNVRRFQFDEVDTIRYWYNDILHIFPTVSQNQILEIAERWILDKWGAKPDVHIWREEPRKARYDERRFGLWSNSHGSFPTVERYRTHLEWNAMYCVVGELLTTHPISKTDEYYFHSFDYWLGRVLPTVPPAWLSDNRGPTPLEPRLWKEDPRTDSGWVHNVRRDEYLTELGIHKSPREGWIIVDGVYTAHFQKREANIRISSALVLPEAAPALVRALQTVNNPWNFRIPYENDDLQLDAPPYRLIGWLAHSEGDSRFDERDPFRYETGEVQAKPGSKLTEMFGLELQAGNHGTWIRNHTGEVALLYEAWCDEPAPEDDYYPRTIRSNGWRLWARTDMVQSFLRHEKWDLIYEVKIERRLRKEYSRVYEEDAKNKTHDKIFLLHADGSIDDAKGRVGSWEGSSRRTRSRS